MGRKKQRTLIILKPETFNRPHLIEDIKTRFKKKRFEILKEDSYLCTREQAEDHYQEHQHQDYYSNLMNQMVGSTVIVIIMEKNRAIEKARELIGPFREGERIPGTIRGDYMSDGDEPHVNYIHASDSVENAKREIAVWFPEG